MRRLCTLLCLRTQMYPFSTHTHTHTQLVDGRTYMFRYPHHADKRKTFSLLYHTPAFRSYNKVADLRDSFPAHIARVDASDDVARLDLPASVCRASTDQMVHCDVVSGFLQKSLRPNQVRGTMWLYSRLRDPKGTRRCARHACFLFGK